MSIWVLNVIIWAVTGMCAAAGAYAGAGMAMNHATRRMEQLVRDRRG